jgi:hypothetical protein
MPAFAEEVNAMDVKSRLLALAKRLEQSLKEM